MQIHTKTKYSFSLKAGERQRKAREHLEGARESTTERTRQVKPPDRKFQNAPHERNNPKTDVCKTP
jgi:hypothetical protein